MNRKIVDTMAKEGTTVGHLNNDTRDALKRFSTATITLQLLKRGMAPLTQMSERLVSKAVTLRFIPMGEDLSTPTPCRRELS
jgi:capsid protein